MSMSVDRIRQHAVTLVANVEVKVVLDDNCRTVKLWGTGAFFFSFDRVGDKNSPPAVQWLALPEHEEKGLMGKRYVSIYAPASTPTVYITTTH